jgi:hypothetical protein
VVSAPLVTVAAYAVAAGRTERTVQRWVKAGRIPGVMVDGVRLIPADAIPSSADVAVTSATSDVSPVSPASTPSPLGELGTLTQAARILGTSRAGVIALAERPETPFIVGPFGPGNPPALRVYVVPRHEAPR